MRNKQNKVPRTLTRGGGWGASTPKTQIYTGLQYQVLYCYKIRVRFFTKASNITTSQGPRRRCSHIKPQATRRRHFSSSCSATNENAINRARETSPPVARYRSTKKQQSRNTGPIPGTPPRHVIFQSRSRTRLASNYPCQPSPQRRVSGRKPTSLPTPYPCGTRRRGP